MDWFTAFIGLAGVVVGFVAAAFAALLSSRDAAKAGFMKVDGNGYRVVPMGGGHA